MESRPLPPDWTSQYDDREQRLFFTNTLTQYRTWEDPRPAFYAQKEQGYQQGYPSYPPPQQYQPPPPQYQPPPQQYQPPPQQYQPPPQQYQPPPQQHHDCGPPSYENQCNMPQNLTNPPPPNNSYTNSGYSGYSEETVYVQQQQQQEEEEKHSSGIGVGGAVAIAAGVGILGAVAGGLIANHQNHKKDDKHKVNNTGRPY
ncbi:hypothetical protein BDF19DRAFT_465466 [Syncephalis fuscata]|nr:hypothetical protein BDF19DRAFT_465466 [Syncephalis fuscata]